MCDEVKVTPNSAYSCQVEIEGFNVEHLLDYIDEEDIKDWVKNHLSVDDVFSTSELDKWAESEGYIKAETQND